LAEKYGEVKYVKVDWDNMGRSKVQIPTQPKETAVIEYYNEADTRAAVD
jgi:RNA recognition motif-containing protein